MNEVYNEDCMIGMARYPDKYFDLAIVDPPYRDQKDNAPTKDMRQKAGDLKKWENKPRANYFSELFRISQNQIIWGGNNFIDDLYSTNCFIFWYKQNPMDNYSDGELAWTSFNRVAKCLDWRYYGNLNNNKIKDTAIHPTQKPVELYEWLLMNYAKEGDKILDTHLGSGSSRIAAYKLGFDFTGFELDKEYFEASEKRFKEVTSQLTIF